MNDNHKDTGRDDASQSRWTAYALGELDATERQAVESEMAASAEARRFAAETQAVAERVRKLAEDESARIGPSAGLRALLEHRLAPGAAGPEPEPKRRQVMSGSERRSAGRRWVFAGAACAATLLVAAPVYFAWLRPALRETAWQPMNMKSLAGSVEPTGASLEAMPRSDGDAFRARPKAQLEDERAAHKQGASALRMVPVDRVASSLREEHLAAKPEEKPMARPEPPPRHGQGQGMMGPAGATSQPTPGYYANMPQPGQKPAIAGATGGGEESGQGSGEGRQSQPGAGQQVGNYPPPISGPAMPGMMHDGSGIGDSRIDGKKVPYPGDQPMSPHDGFGHAYDYGAAPGTEQYDPIQENPFLPVAQEPQSTFSIDVDTASYANVRRFLIRGQWPPRDAVRIEEMVNYFHYDYPLPQTDAPFSASMEVTQCPWEPGHRLLRVGLKGREIDRRERGLSNLVFLLDVSGSMADQDKLPLVKQAMAQLVGELDENDRVAIVTYAGNSGLHLESTAGHDKDRILQAIERLQAGGSTHGSAGIQLAYDQAVRYFFKGGVNRVLWCTDGDLNVGVTRDEDLVKLIEEKRQSGVFLTVLGFGTGNLKDSKLEKLADHGNGLYAYIDNLREARKVLVEQLTGSLITIAKDVKIQIEFNPAQVAQYRLVGYENRVMAAEDFANDKKDAGEIGAGHTVTALYELVPAAGASRGPDQQGADRPAGDGPLKYQRERRAELTQAAESGELLTLSLRYKEPDGEKSKLLQFALKDEGKKASKDFQFAAAVAQFGMLLRGSRHAGQATLSAVEEIASSALGDDPGGYRAEFVDLVRRAKQLGRGPR